ncbi:uncharacterized protein MEPE_00921 [Melanopsichium pennsylvanicum]|uniref:Uncharacterized protein n=1 Tax=Melanopsichium pennsylvanicum TaxID=63383 RepID=A0AAJ5C343_9BASI|nr:uncharacterized protein MEPE_00921 [Melanopsichium pennsylvanicum]
MHMWSPETSCAMDLNGRPTQGKGRRLSRVQVPSLYVGGTELEGKDTGRTNESSLSLISLGLHAKPGGKKNKKIWTNQTHARQLAEPVKSELRVSRQTFGFANGQKETR